MGELSLQQRWMPHGTCFGCGPANPEGLRLESFPDGEGVIARWSPRPHHNAYPGILCGGVVGTLLDCHTGAALAWALCILEGRDGTDPLPYPFDSNPWVTAGYSVQLRRAAPVDEPVTLRARVLRLDENEATVEATLEGRGKVCATCSATWKKLGRPK
jgi:acyl-coenzyme A thioesterase PaaI-like protein